MTKRVLLLSSVHPATDPRILYKIAPTLLADYEVFCALPGAGYNDRNGLKMIRLPQYKGLLARLILAHPVVIWKCLRLRPDLVHIFVPELIPVALLFQWLGAKIIYEVQENLYKKFEIKGYNNNLIFRKLFKYFDLSARKRFNCLFTEDAYLKEYRNLAKPSAVVHNYVSLAFTDKYSKGTEHDGFAKPAFLYSGVISMERSFDTIVAALVLLKKKYPVFLVHLFGPVRFSRDEAEQLPGYAYVKEHLIFYGYTDLRLVLKYAKQCVAGIALLKPVADYPDSFTTKLFEYMALKLPVVTSDFPLYQEVVEISGCGFCISPYDSQLLADKLEWIIGNPEKTLEMGRNGRKSVESDYNWENEKKNLLSFYKTVLN
ncbi:glycosyltransferase [Dyadobacter psychrotolerans]|uniref:Glycosyltransferase n=1 Tax=Dyadobacter psychrotolerans TaxID=2541721 RepID=A0A4R5D8T2_9BACT|nr:glycosyltransferase [Dyadobacter psychrotolerans]TDE09982.1 glycosyltransferase [Dyadobacter psychrotolerans]